MNNESETSPNISLDSLEVECKRKSFKGKVQEENVDTILIPLYEKDVLIQVPKRKTKAKQYEEKCRKNNKVKKGVTEQKNYLVNKDSKVTKKTSYLEMFRKQFTSNCTEVHNKTQKNEIRSISPEYGDTERESFGCETNYPENDFYNTESYNEIYYDKLMKKELEQYLEHSFEENLHFNQELTKFEDDINVNNLKSVSEVSQPRRRAKNKSVPRIQNVRLGGLGPDMENIKPRLERARSLQRYSEKVRMENRLKIYKKGVENENNDKEASVMRRDSINNKSKEHKDIKVNSSYLINKTVQEKPSLIRKICPIKSKSTQSEKNRGRETFVKEKNNSKNNPGTIKKDKKSNENTEVGPKKPKSTREDVKDLDGPRTYRAKSSARTRGINTESKRNDIVSPMQISFLVNVGGVRPSSAMRSLEEKHRMYQEKVKPYFTDCNNV